MKHTQDLMKCEKPPLYLITEAGLRGFGSDECVSPTCWISYQTRLQLDTFGAEPKNWTV